jgi:hypothetical protein
LYFDDFENFKNGEESVDGAELDFLFFCSKFGSIKRVFKPIAV